MSLYYRCEAPPGFDFQPFPQSIPPRPAPHRPSAVAHRPAIATLPGCQSATQRHRKRPLLASGLGHGSGAQRTANRERKERLKRLGSRRGSATHSPRNRERIGWLPLCDLTSAPKSPRFQASNHRKPLQETGSATAPRRTLSGLDTDRWDLGIQPPTIRKWQHETKLRAPRRHFSIQRRAAKETANWVWGTRSSPGSEDSVRRFTQLAGKKKCVGTASINSDLPGITRIKKSAAQEIVSVAAAQTTIEKNSLKIPFIESNAATVSKSGARKTPTI